MNDNGSLHVITTELSQILDYDVEFNCDTLCYDSHLRYLIKFIFTDRKLCQLYGKYSQRDYARMNELELIYPLVRYGFIIIIGISDNLLIYLPQNMDSKQYEKINSLLNKYNNYDIAVHFSRLNENEELKIEDNFMNVSNAVEYINKQGTIRKFKSLSKS